MRHPFVALRESSLLLVIDLQAAMLKVMDDWQETARRVNQLTRAADALGVPVVVTEHYRKGLGETIPEVAGVMTDATVLHKDHFSACMETEFLGAIRSFGRRQIIVTGMEAHVCVLQTGLDLIQNGYQVQLVVDAVSSRAEFDRDVGVGLFRQAGAVITCTEAVIFQWAFRAGTEEFRKILPIVK